MDREAAMGKSTASEIVATAPPPVSTNAPTPKNYDETKIQIRLLDGQKLVQTFKAKESLSAVRLFVQMNRPSHDTSPIKLMTSFPRKVFAVEDYEKPLDILGLCPSAVIILAK